MRDHASTTAATRPHRPELRPLTAFRFWAALLVFVHHALTNVINQDYAGRTVPSWMLLARQGYVGVAFFFVLSGFILAYNYHDRFERLDARRVGRFYVARVARVVPLHLVTFLLFVPGAFLGLALTSWPRQLGTGFANLLLLQGWVPLDGPEGVPMSFNAPSWSLSCELFFYLACPVLLWLAVGVLQLTTRGLLVVAASGWLAVGMLAALFHGDRMALWFFYTYPPVRLVDFVVGLSLGLWFARTRRGAGTVEPHARRGVATAVEVGALGALAAVFCLHGDHVWLSVQCSFLFVPPTALVIGVFAFQRGLVSRVASSRLLVHLGEISFSFYMVHFLTLVVAAKAGFYDRASPYAVAAVCLVVTLALSELGHRAVELPARDRVRSWGERRLLGRRVDDGPAVVDGRDGSVADAA